MATFPASTPAAPTPTPALPGAGHGRRLRRLSGLLRFCRKHPSAAIGGFGVLFFLVLCYLGPLVIAPPRIDVNAIYAAPSAQHVFGADNQGKDILTQIIHGGRPVITVAFMAGIITTLIAITLGALAAYVGGPIDRLINGVANFLLTIPYLVAMTVLASLIRLDSPILLAMLLAFWSWPVLMRTVRSQVLTLREREYVEAAVALNLRTSHIIFREILPNMASYIAISFIFSMTSAIYAQIALITLGLVPLSGDSWGLMIFKARTLGTINSPDTAWSILAPVLAIALFQWSLVTLARSIEEIFNPRLKSGA